MSRRTPARARRSSGSCTTPRCTATSCASASTRCSGRSGPLSYGTLYPCLATCSAAAGSPRRRHDGSTAPPSPSSRRARIVYELTADGKDHFQSLISQSGPAAWEDDNFDVHFAFFARTEAAVRLRILEGRRSRLEERLDAIRDRRRAGPRAPRPVHRRAAAPRPRLGRARGALAHRADRHRARGPPQPPPCSPARTRRGATQPQNPAGTHLPPPDTSPYPFRRRTPWDPFASPSSASATAPARWSGRRVLQGCRPERQRPRPHARAVR